MKRTLAWLAPLVVGSLAAAAPMVLPGDPTPETLEGYTAGIAERVPDRLERDGVPGAAVAVVVEAETVWSDGFGVADRGSRTPVTSETAFQAGSISKSLTAWAVVSLAESGRIELDAPVEGQVPGWQLPPSGHPADEVTPRRLLGHTAGLPFAIDGVPTSVERLRAGDVDPARFTVVHDPGERFVYSNPGYAVLGLLLEEAGGRPLSTVMDERVLTPLRMDDSTFELDDRLAEQAATGYTADGQPVPVDWTSPVGASGLHTTANDLAGYLAALHDGGTREVGGQTPSADGIALLHRPHTVTAGIPHRLMAESSGLGHFVDTLADGTRVVAHAGEEEGWVGGYVTVPDTGDGLVVLTNSRRAYPLLTDELAAWADWRDLDTLRITRSLQWLAAGARAIVGMAAAGVVVLAWTVLADLRRGARPRAPWTGPRRGRRLGRLVVAVLLPLVWWGLAAGLLTTFLPLLTRWVGVTLTVWALLLAAATLMVSPARTEGGSRGR